MAEEWTGDEQDFDNANLPMAAVASQPLGVVADGADEQSARAVAAFADDLAVTRGDDLAARASVAAAPKRRKFLKSEQPKPATRGKLVKRNSKRAAAITVDSVNPSVNRWAFRLRPRRADNTRGVYYTCWVSAAVFQLITEDEQGYEQFKQRLIEEYGERALRAANRNRASDGGTS